MIGFGAPNGGHRKGPRHGARRGGDRQDARGAGLAHAPFVIPDDVLARWREVGARGAGARAAWRAAAGAARHALAVSERSTGKLPGGYAMAMAQYRRPLRGRAQVATRQSSRMVLDVIAGAAELIGGSADLTGSNMTLVKTHQPMRPDGFAGRYIHYGVREHGMAAAMNGIALHGGFIPYGGTFLAFADYAARRSGCRR